MRGSFPSVDTLPTYVIIPAHVWGLLLYFLIIIGTTTMIIMKLKLFGFTSIMYTYALLWLLMKGIHIGMQYRY